MGIVARTASANEQPGSILAGKYRILRVVGSGGMGVVYEALHLYTNRHVAVKLMHPDVASSREAVRRFLQEAQAQASVGHPGVAEVLDAGQDPDDGTLYLVLELLEGESLGALMERGAVDVPSLVHIAHDLLDALAAAHARGLVHRDIKPENVFLLAGTKPPRVKLLDFGIAKRVTVEGPSDVTGSGTVVGTPWYMGPEQARGSAVDARADIWSVGAVMFHALAGRPPFEGDNFNVLVARILTGTPPRLNTLQPALPASLADIVDRALRPDPSMRWQSAAAMASALAALNPIATTSAPVPLTAEPTPTSTAWSGRQPAAVSAARRRAWLAQAPVLVFAALLCLGVAHYARGTTAPRPPPAVARDNPRPVGAQVAALPAMASRGGPHLAPHDRASLTDMLPARATTVSTPLPALLVAAPAERSPGRGASVEPTAARHARRTVRPAMGALGGRHFEPLRRYR